MSTHRCSNYKKIQHSILLDEEERLLRDAGATTRADVEAFWTARYPLARHDTRDIVIDELTRRLEDAS